VQATSAASYARNVPPMKAAYPPLNRPGRSARNAKPRGSEFSLYRHYEHLLEASVGLNCAGACTMIVTRVPSGCGSNDFSGAAARGGQEIGCYSDKNAKVGHYRNPGRHIGSQVTLHAARPARWQICSRRRRTTSAVRVLMALSPRLAKHFDPFGGFARAYRACSGNPLLARQPRAPGADSSYVPPDTA